VSAALIGAAVLATGVVAAGTSAHSLRSASAAQADQASGDRREVDPSAAPTLETLILSMPAPPGAGDPVRLRPVAGLSQSQMDNAVVIVEVAQRMNLPRRAAVVAITTALQETQLRNLANASVPASLKFPHQGVDANFDSIGVFQQRPSQGWGTVAQLMDPATSARLFYARLVKVPGWQTMGVGAAAQAVQRSAFPTAYDKQQTRALRIVDAIA
jgi:hypothetical protein